jgi:PAS domain S-box-containing protein
MEASITLESVFDVASFIHEYYGAWSGTDLDRIMSYYADDVVLQIPGLLMEGKEAVRNQFARPFTTAFPGNRHFVKNMIFGPGVVNVEFSFEAEHKGPFAGHAATGARISLPGCGVYEYDSATRQITAGRIYFDVGTLLQTITDALVDDRQKSEEALRTNERNLSLITNVIPTFIHVLRTNGSVLYVNQAVLGYTGLTLEDVRKEDYHGRVFHPDDVERLREERTEALLRPVPFENEQRVLGKDGKYRWFLIRYNPLLDEQERIDRWYVAAFDIEDRKRAEDALVRQAGVRADVSTAFSQPIHLGEILRGCTEAIVRHLDAAFARIWTLSKDESMLELQASAGMYTRLDGSYSRIPVGDLKVGSIAREKKAHFTNDVMNDPRVSDKDWAQSNGMVAFAGYPLLVEDRLIGVVALFARRTLSESILDTLATVADTIAQGIERKRAEGALRNALDEIQKSESKLRQVIDAIPALAWCNLPDGPNEFLNKGWHEYTGLSAEQSHGWSWQNAFHPDDLPALMEKWMKMLTSGEPDEIEARLRRHDGVYRWFLIRAQPFRDESGTIIRWYGTSTDIEDRKEAEQALRASERNLAAIINTIPTTAWTTRPDGYCDFLNQVWLDYAGMSTEQAQGWGWAEAIHPDDRERLVEVWQSCLASGTPVETEARIRRFDSSYRWFLIRANPLRDESGNILKWYGTCIDIEDRKRGEEALRASELDARSLLDNMPGFLARLGTDGTPEFVNRRLLQYFGRTLEDMSQWRMNDMIHPQDLPRTIEVFGEAISTGQPFNLEYRLRRFDGVYRWFEARFVAVRNAEGEILHWNALVTDIEDRKRAEEALQLSELNLRQVIDTIPTLIHVLGPDGSVLYVNPGVLDYTGLTLEEVKRRDYNVRVGHPEDDPESLREQSAKALSSAVSFECEYRVRRKDGQYRWFLTRYNPLLDDQGKIDRWYVTSTDIDDRKRAEDAVRKSEKQLRDVIETMPVIAFTTLSDGTTEFVNRRWIEYTGLAAEAAGDYRRVTVHPEDIERHDNSWQESLASGKPFEKEVRHRGANGQYRWFLVRCVPLRDQDGSILKWFGTMTDIEDRKQAEEEIQNENIALREEIIRASMFEEIVGNSPTLQEVLTRVAKVAPTGSTILITGETGTGKELIARAIHKGSKRSDHAFVSVNCAAIPQSLIASELFGHEKGAFTGATQRRLGRFELAEGGTIFLDEVGELPAETQIALLRVLQEREFERVGGTKVIRADVRVIAATNRDLQASIDAGTFRNDLYYRLNVFPIEVPPLRKRKQDIPLLVAYFMDRYNSKVGKKIRYTDSATLERLLAYPWPGNVRELQNVMERSIILCETDKFTVDESWLSRRLDETEPASRPLFKIPTSEEKRSIETALAEAQGRVSGPSGAAAKLGIPPSTLDSKIKSLKINKHRFKTV